MHQTTEFEKLGNSIDSWQLHAEFLISSARVLKKERITNSSPSQEDPFPVGMRVTAVELMLYGYAIEALFKTIWLDKGNLFVKDGKFLNLPKTGDHQLDHIAYTVGIISIFSKDEKRVLRILSKFITGFGRYPIQKSVNQTEMHKSEEWQGDSDYTVIDQIFSKIRANLKNDIMANYPNL